MSAIKFVTDNPDFHNSQAVQSSAWLKVFNQAKEHTRDVEKSKLTEAARPHEPPEIQDYRNNNDRKLTKADVEKYRTKTGRIYRSSGLRVNEATLSDWLKEELAANPYEYLGTPTNLMDYVMNEVYARSIDDANFVSIVFPYNDRQEYVPPIWSFSEGGIPKNERVPMKTISIPSSEITYFSSELFAWKGGLVSYKKGKHANVYWLVDKTSFWLWYPITEKHGKVQYELIEWYPHNTGSGEEKVLPVNLAIGVLAFQENDQYQYQNSILHGYFEYADEFSTRFSDGQGVWINFSSPVKVVAAKKCGNPECYKGNVKTFDDKTGKANGTKSCNDCGGEGMNYTASPYGYYVKREVKDGETVDSKPYEVIGAQADAVEMAYNIPFDLLKKGRESIGLDVLIGLNESGVAKDKRLEDTKDKIADNADKIKKWIENHLFFKECLGQIDRSKRIIPVVNVPIDFDLKSSEDYRIEVEKALPNDRIEKELNYYRSIYANNESLLKIYKVALSEYPLIVLEWSELKEREMLGYITKEDIVRVDNVIPALRKISKGNDWLKLENEKIVQKVDEMLISKGLISSPIDNETKSKGKLLESIGGVKSIIEVTTAISNNELSQEAGKTILKTVFGFNDSDAAQLANVPQQTPNNE